MHLRKSGRWIRMNIWNEESIRPQFKSELRRSQNIFRNIEVCNWIFGQRDIRNTFLKREFARTACGNHVLPGTLLLLKPEFILTGRRFNSNWFHKFEALLYFHGILRPIFTDHSDTYVTGSNLFYTQQRCLLLTEQIYLIS